jgi:hypothetical protein
MVLAKMAGIAYVSLSPVFWIMWIVWNKVGLFVVTSKLLYI